MSIRKSSKDKHGVKVKEKRSTITIEAWERLVKKKKGQAQDVIYEIMSGNKIPDGLWETQIGIIFENRIREKPKNEKEPLQYPTAKHVRTLLKKSLEWMDDYFQGVNIHTYPRFPHQKSTKPS